MYKKIVFILTLLLFCSLSQTQAQLRKAASEMRFFNYTEAIKTLQKTIQKGNDDTLQARKMLAECYRRTNEMENAKKCYSMLVSSGKADTMSYFYYGLTLKNTGGYEKAKDMFALYGKMKPDDPKAKIFEAFCDSAIKWKNNLPLYEVRNIGSLNSAGSDFSPVFFDQGIIFTSDRKFSSKEKVNYGWTGNSFLHLFTGVPLNPDAYSEEYHPPVLLDGYFNQDFHDGPATVNAAGNEMYFNRTFRYRDKGKKEEKTRTHLLKIFYCEKKDGKWQKPEPFFLNNDDYSVGHPALSPDGKMLYFVSNPEDGFGGTDIYVCTRENGEWSAPQNLGPEINTFGNEMFPFIAENGDLCFSSDGHPGFGGLDIFICKNVNGKWTKPVNQGEPLNSSYDDFGISEYKSGNSGLFSSNRPGGKGNDDIYSYTRLPERPAPVRFLTLSGYVRNKITNEPVPGATVFVMEKESGKVMVLRSGSNGYFSMKVERRSVFVIKGMKTGFISDCISSDDASEAQIMLPRDLLLEKLEINRDYTLQNIYYDYDKWNIRKDAEPSLDNLVKIMKETPVTVELGSNTDSRGSDDYNMKLSQLRAEAAVKYIISKGIDPKRITAHGYGETKPVNKCTNGVKCSETDYQKNRRTEFKVLSVSSSAGQDSFDPDKFKEGDNIDVGALPEGFFLQCNNSMSGR